MYNILITALGGDISQGILKAVKLFTPDSRIIGTDKYPNSAGLFACQKAFVIRPAAGEDARSFVERIGEICNTEKIDIAFIGHEAEQAAIAEHRDYLNSITRTYFVVQSADVLQRCSDKFITYNFLQKKGIRVPETYVDMVGGEKLIKKHGFPIVIKPRQSCGSRGFHPVNDNNELEKFWQENALLMMQEYITNGKGENGSGEEYTVGIFLDQSAKTINAIPMLRQLRFGLTWYAFVDDYPDIVETAVQAAEAVGAVGPCNVQLRRDRENKPCVIEINARISSTVAFRAKLGFNEVAAAIDYFLHKKKPKLDFKKGMVMKTWDEVVIPLGKYSDLEKNNFLSDE